MWHLDLLLGGDCEIVDCTAAVVRQRPANNNRRMVFTARSTKQQLNSNKETAWIISESYIQNIRGLNFSAIKLTTVQVTNLPL
jgi:hypothetical protein